MYFIWRLREHKAYHKLILFLKLFLHDLSRAKVKKPQLIRKKRDVASRDVQKTSTSNHERKYHKGWDRSWNLGRRKMYHFITVRWKPLNVICCSMWSHLKAPFTKNYCIKFTGYCYHVVNVITFSLAKVITLSGFYCNSNVPLFALPQCTSKGSIYFMFNLKFYKFGHMGPQ